ncbi:MAG: dihydroorotate dehydrogenase electron transfer subunit [Defluviitaleaceae bacterium]|nr:dihydroorotate dehydrogenase electron transfer subunit [Defluviitaleaceae bacterium]
MENDGSLSFWLKVSIRDNHCISPDIFSVKVAAPDVAKSAKSGQFIMVYLDKGELLLPRPISIHDINDNEIEIIYQVVGKGTLVLSQMQSGQEIKILAPLGNGFTIPANAKKAAIVGGGIGTPPLYHLAKTLASLSIATDVYLGFRSAPILAEKFRALKNGEVHIATEDGSHGHRGFVTDIFEPQNYEQIFACGPEPMLHAVSALAARAAIPCQVSMEQRMACGIGTCVGCVIRVGEQYARVCCEGPVFDAKEVFL